MYRFKLLFDNDYFDVNSLCLGKWLLQPTDMLAVLTEEEYNYTNGMLILHGLPNKLVRVPSMAQLSKMVGDMKDFQGVVWRVESLFSTVKAGKYL